MKNVLKLKENETGLKVIHNKKTDAYEILMYGAIGENPWDDSAISANSFMKELNAIPANAKEIHLRVNSPGGSVFDGMTMFERLKQHNAKVIAYVDGIAASIASLIIMGADEIVIGEGGFLMIHKPMAGAYGNTEELNRTVDILDKIEEQMISIYVKKTGLSRIELSRMLSEETWITADESIEMNFVDTKIEASSQLRVAASMVKNTPWFRKHPEIKDIETKREINNALNDIKDFLAR
jgi:ATP-dependent Clp protease protease subunit